MKNLKNFRFRAVSSAEHTVIFGNGIVEVGEKIYLIQLDEEVSRKIEVQAASIEQLICYDDNGKEIFENDFVEDAEKNKYKAVMLQSFEKNNSYIPAWNLKNIYLIK